MVGEETKVTIKRWKDARSLVGRRVVVPLADGREVFVDKITGNADLVFIPLVSYIDQHDVHAKYIVFEPKGYRFCTNMEKIKCCPKCGELMFSEYESKCSKCGWEYYRNAKYPVTLNIKFWDDNNKI